MSSRPARCADVRGPMAVRKVPVGLTWHWNADMSIMTFVGNNQCESMILP